MNNAAIQNEDPCAENGNDSAAKTAPAFEKSAPVRARHEKIVQLILSKGFVTIENLAQEFNMTPQTLRRDINMLSDEGLIVRYHGGAGLPSSTENVEYNQRKVLCLEEKQHIARLVAEHVPNNASLFINIGTTTEEISKMLCNHQRLRVITNNLNVASILSRNENFEIIVTGGLIRPLDGGIIGPLTIDCIEQFRVDIGIIGISGIDVDGTLLDFDYREVRASRAIMDNSRKVFLATDHTKFGRNAMVRLGNVSEIDALFTDRQPPAALVEILEAAAVELHVCDIEA
jgi:DeoR family glycerol-3-phosphate regulon repressor